MLLGVTLRKSIIMMLNINLICFNSAKIMRACCTQCAPPALPRLACSRLLPQAPMQYYRKQQDSRRVSPFHKASSGVVDRATCSRKVKCDCLRYCFYSRPTKPPLPSVVHAISDRKSTIESVIDIIVCNDYRFRHRYRRQHQPNRLPNKDSHTDHNRLIEYNRYNHLHPKIDRTDTIDRTDHRTQSA